MLIDFVGEYLFGIKDEEIGRRFYTIHLTIDEIEAAEIVKTVINMLVDVAQGSIVGKSAKKLIWVLREN